MEFSIKEAKIQLFDLLTSGADLNSLCNCLAKFVGNPVALTLPTRTIIALSNDYSNELLEEYTSTGKLMSDDEYRAMDNDFQKNFSTGKAEIFLWPYTHYKHLNCGCLYKKSFVAVLDCPVVNELPTPEQLSIFEAAAAMFVTAMKSMGMLSGYNLQPMNEFLTALLTGNINLDYQKLYMHDSVFEKAKSFQIVRLKLRDNVDANICEIRLNNFCVARKSWWCIPYDNGFVILLDAKENSNLPALAEAFGTQLRICVSDEFERINDALSHLELACMTIKYSESNIEPSILTYVDDYKPLIAYSYAHSNSGLNIFTSNILDKIKEYDKKYNTSYMETLRVCIHYNQEPGLIAEQLHLHKNTVFYRLRQLRELFGVDLKNTRQLVNLYFALFIEYHK